MVFSSGRINKVRGEQENKYFIASKRRQELIIKEREKSDLKHNKSFENLD